MRARLAELAALPTHDLHQRAEHRLLLATVTRLDRVESYLGLASFKGSHLLSRQQLVVMDSSHRKALRDRFYALSVWRGKRRNSADDRQELTFLTTVINTLNSVERIEHALE